MSDFKRYMRLAAIGMALASSSYAAQTQENQSEAVIGPPQLKDFSLQPRDRPATQPPPVTSAPPPLIQVPAPAPVPAQPRPVTPAPTSAAPRPQAPTTRTPAATAQAVPAVTRDAPPQPEPGGGAPSVSQPDPAPAGDTFPSAAIPDPTAAEPAPVVPAAPEGASEGTSGWMFAIPVVGLLIFGGLFLLRRRRRQDAAGDAEDLPVVAAPPPAPEPRPAPVARPWLELSLKAERATFTAEEAEIQFELEVSNKGGSAAKNLRIDVKMFNAGAEQDKEIGVFFKTAGREATKLRLPGVEAGVTGVIRGSVGMKREEIRAMRLDERLLFIPVVAVNALYDYDGDRTGQTSRSYLVGREAEASEKMGPFRVDQGPRIWRTVGQRPHKLSKRV